MDMIVRMPQAAFVNMRVRVRSEHHGVTLLDAAEFPKAHRQAPPHKKHADNQVAQDSEVEASDEVEKTAMQAEHADQHLHKFDRAHYQCNDNRQTGGRDVVENLA